MKTYSVTCPYCKSKAFLRPANVVYGISPRSTGKHLYVCANWPRCDAYVSAHHRDKRPMGGLANGSLRHKRILAHKALEEYRKLTRMDKWAVYIWLEGKLGLGEHQIHIAKFSDVMCDRVISICEAACRSYKASQKAG